MPLPTTHANIIKLFSLPFLNENTSVTYNDYTQLINALTNASEEDVLTLESFNLLYDKDELRVPLSYDKAVSYNYVAIAFDQSPSEPSKWYFCYITDYKLMNSEVVALSLRLDTWLTNYPNVDNITGLLDRVHSPRYILKSGTSPKYYMVSKDLYYAEDEPSVNYKPTYEDVLKLNCVDYVALTFAIPLSSIKDKTITINDTPYQCKAYQDPLTNVLLTDIIVTNFNQNVRVKRLSNLFNTYGMFGNTTLMTLVVSVKRLSKTEPDLNVNYYCETYEELFTHYPSLKDKVLSCVMLPPVYDSTNLNKCCVAFTELLPTDFPILVEGGKAIIYVEDTKDFNVTLNPTLKLTKFNNNSVYSNDEIYTDYYNEEPKLKLYPYSYYKVHMFNDEIVYKYQDLNVQNQSVYGQLQCFIDIFGSSISAIFVKTYDKYEVSPSGGIDKTSLTCLSLPTMSIFEDQYDQYRNYNKAMVDNNLLFGGISMGLSSIATIGGAIATGGLSTLATTELGTKAYQISAGKSASGVPSGVVSYIQEVTQAKTNEQMLKRKPPIERGQMSNQSSYFIDYGDSNNDHMLSKIYFMELNENEIVMIYNKFYFYGYKTPVVFNGNYYGLSVLFRSRTMFNFVKFTNCVIYGNINYVYKKDMENRLIHGITFFHINPQNDNIYLNGYGILPNNETTEFRDITAPIFAKE